jgi:hypothetical protein
MGRVRAVSLQIPPLRFAPFGMTRGEKWLTLQFLLGS